MGPICCSAACGAATTQPAHLQVASPEQQLHHLQPGGKHQAAMESASAMGAQTGERACSCPALGRASHSCGAPSSAPAPAPALALPPPPQPSPSPAQPGGWGLGGDGCGLLGVRGGRGGPGLPLPASPARPGPQSQGPQAGCVCPIHRPPHPPHPTPVGGRREAAPALPPGASQAKPGHGSTPCRPHLVGLGRTRAVPAQYPHRAAPTWR